MPNFKKKKRWTGSARWPSCIITLRQKLSVTFRFWRWATQDTPQVPVAIHPRVGATQTNPVDTHPKRAATHLRQAATHLRQAAILLQQGASPLRPADTPQQRAVTPRQQEATLQMPAVTLQLGASLLKRDTNRSLVPAVIPPCLLQVTHTKISIKEVWMYRRNVKTVNIILAAGGWGAAPGGYGQVNTVFRIPYSSASLVAWRVTQAESHVCLNLLIFFSSVGSQEELSRDTQEVLPQASPCQITPQPPAPTPQCLRMEVERRLTLRHLPSL